MQTKSDRGEGRLDCRCQCGARAESTESSPRESVWSNWHLFSPYESTSQFWRHVGLQICLHLSISWSGILDLQSGFMGIKPWSCVSKKKSARPWMSILPRPWQSSLASWWQAPKFAQELGPGLGLFEPWKLYIIEGEQWLDITATIQTLIISKAWGACLLLVCSSCVDVCSCTLNWFVFLPLSSVVVPMLVVSSRMCV